jgi:hypothetical protein
LVNELNQCQERYDRAHDDERPADRGIERHGPEPRGVPGCTGHVPFVPSRGRVANPPTI